MTTDEHLKIFAATYKSCLKNYVDESFVFEKELIKYFHDKYFEEGFDPEQFGRDAFLIQMKVYQEHYAALEEAVKITKQIINKKV